MGKKIATLRFLKFGAKTAELTELLVFSIIVLLPAILSNFGLDASPDRQHAVLYSQIGFIKELLSSLQFGLVAAFFLSRNGRAGWSEAASNEIAWPMQVLAGIGLWFAYYLFFDFWAVIAALAHIRNPSIGWLHPTGGNESLLNGVFALVNGPSEEIMRVYLLSQTQRAGLGRTGAAIAVALAISSYHLYQGAFTVAAFILVNIVLNKLYISKKPLLTLIVWHILSDFMHSTDLAGWQFVTEMVNGSLGMGLYALSHFLGLAR